MSEEGGKPTTVLPPRERPGLFEAFGVEIETMIVDADTFAVRPICDELMTLVSGTAGSEVELGELAWSNELTLHVLELKTNGPAEALAGLATAFHRSVARANEALAGLGARLMPGAVHPWMDPATETELWPHEYTEVYHTFDRIFGCSGHGWANLQSTHLNLPFSDDEEFGRLHAAVRLVLPLIPALSAASPYLDGRLQPELDARLAAYRDNAHRVPSVTGRVVPEPALTRAGYEKDILGRIYADLAPLDPQGVLRHEWANARGAIARFDRGTVEIRIIDAQECPAADLAVVAAVSEAVRTLAQGPLAERDVALDPPTDALADLLDRTLVEADAAVVDDDRLLRTLGLDPGARPAGRVWRELVDRHPPPDPLDEWSAHLEAILTRGPLARRLVDAVGRAPTPDRLREMARELCACLDANASFPTSGRGPR